MSAWSLRRYLEGRNGEGVSWGATDALKPMHGGVSSSLFRQRVMGDRAISAP